MSSFLNGLGTNPFEQKENNNKSFFKEAIINAA